MADLTRINVNLTPRSVAALEFACELTGDNRTDTLNRSVQVYAYVSKLMSEGKLIFAEDPTAGTRERLIFL